jgi:hypothetical protein
VNQNQFFRHIRNFVFDLTEMPPEVNETVNYRLVPTGIHWQVAQATTLERLSFKMPARGQNTTHVGIFMENGSGGFVSNLDFTGGAIGWRAGSQQYTARSLTFRGCATAIQMVWDWGFNWQRVDIEDVGIGIDIAGFGGKDGQGIGSISLIDSVIKNAPVGIMTREKGINKTDGPPNIVLDNVQMQGVSKVIWANDTGNTILPGSGSDHFPLWAYGYRQSNGQGSPQLGPVSGVSDKPYLLLDGGKLFTKDRPHYASAELGDIYVATDYSIANDGTGDQTDAINKFLEKAAFDTKIAFFPAGIYQVQGTVKVPINSRIQGSHWSQIQGTGSYFGDITSPKVMVQVGSPGESGVVEIVEMLFSVKGPTAGAILMQWNVREEKQGSVGMWDSHFRVGGALGSDLDLAKCRQGGESIDKNCIAASMLFHVTPESSGYFENVWVWTADHDNDVSVVDLWSPEESRISVYTGRGTLVESRGPCWFYGSGSEHSVLYQYQFYQARNIYIGHLQTESPYYQPKPAAPEPFTPGGFPKDPAFAAASSFNLNNVTGPRDSWAVRIIDSSDIIIHSAGMYNFFDNYQQDCIKSYNCQDKLIKVAGSERISIFNIFTIGTSEVVSGPA